ncbi:hypothetical protein ABFS83_02G157300 [Erythranthe nasuta]
MEVDLFANDVTSHILGFLNDPVDVIRAGAVSQSWRHFVIANGICKKLWLKRVPIITSIACEVEEGDGIIKLLDIASRNSVNWETLETEHRIFSSLLHPLAKQIIYPNDILAFPIGASSTDHGLAENIINTLTPIDRYPNGASYWSSKGEVDPDVPENIIYRLKSGVCIVTEVNIRPFEAFWEFGKPVYSAKSVRFRMGHPKSTQDMGMEVFPVDKPCVDKYEWTYTSLEFPMTQEACLQQFKLPEPVICVGGVFQVELLGRAQMEEINGLYYICLGYVRVLGQSLDPAYNLEMYPSGEFGLRYYPHGLDYVLRSISGESVPSKYDSDDETSAVMAALLPAEMVEEVLMSDEDEWW